MSAQYSQLFARESGIGLVLQTCVLRTCGSDKPGLVLGCSCPTVKLSVYVSLRYSGVHYELAVVYVVSYLHLNLVNLNHSYLEVHVLSCWSVVGVGVSVVEAF